MLFKNFFKSKLDKRGWVKSFEFLVFSDFSNVNIISADLNEDKDVIIIDDVIKVGVSSCIYENGI